LRTTQLNLHIASCLKTGLINGIKTFKVREKIRKNPSFSDDDDPSSSLYAIFTRDHILLVVVYNKISWRMKWFT